MQSIWWKSGIIYEVYVRSFQDSNNDGTGDIRGVISRLDYLKWLGINAVWLTPVYKSPMADLGYDISDFRAIDPLFGNMDDFDELLREVHFRNMKLIMDFVPNHTSDQHEWFLESRSTRDNPKRDWYLWHTGTTGRKPPNNWLAMFGGSAWEWDEKTGQFYYHAFLKEQPDLNWRNREVREAIYDIMRFWLEKGVDGFRVDAIWHMIKDSKYRDNPVNPTFTEKMTDYDRLKPVHSTDQDEVFEIVREMRTVLDSYKERMMIGEAYVPVERLMKYYGPDGDGCHLPANFILILAEWDPEKIFEAINEYEDSLPEDAWPNWVIGNHDQPRLASKLGPEQARIAAMLLLTLRGTPTIYYGDEIAMRSVDIPKDEVIDPQGKNMPDKDLNRDPWRTPMQWDSSENAGFSGGKPWLRIDDQYDDINVENQKDDNGSMLSFYRRLIALRQSDECLMTGELELITADKQILAFARKSTDCAYTVILNFSDQAATYAAESVNLSGKIELATHREMEGITVNGKLTLPGNQGVIIKKNNKPSP